jgi:YbbR domain-containing protein
MLKSKERKLMKTKFKQKLLMVMMLAMLLAVVPFTEVSAATATKTIGWDGVGIRYGREKTSSVAVAVIPVYDSQALHTKGYSTTIGVSSTKTNSTRASVSITAGVDTIFAELSATLGVSTSVCYADA